MTNFYEKFRDNYKFLCSNIDYLTYDERQEILSTIQYYIQLSIKRKFEYNFNIN